MRINFTGSLTLELLEQACRKLWEHPDFRAGANTLWDLRGITHTAISFDDMKSFGRFLEPHQELIGDSRSAIVADSNLLYGLARMHELLNETNLPAENAVFRDVKEAEKWLGGS